MSQCGKTLRLSSILSDFMLSPDEAYSRFLELYGFGDWQGDPYDAAYRIVDVMLGIVFTFGVLFAFFYVVYHALLGYKQHTAPRQPVPVLSTPKGVVGDDLAKFYVASMLNAGMNDKQLLAVCSRIIPVVALNPPSPADAGKKETRKEEEKEGEAEEEANSSSED